MFYQVNKLRQHCLLITGLSVSGDKQDKLSGQMAAECIPIIVRTNGCRMHSYHCLPSRKNQAMDFALAGLLQITLPNSPIYMYENMECTDVQNKNKLLVRAKERLQITLLISIIHILRYTLFPLTSVKGYNEQSIPHALTVMLRTF